MQENWKSISDEIESICVLLMTLSKGLKTLKT